MMIALILLTLTLIYALFIALMCLGLARLKPVAVNGSRPFVTVIVPARNEEATLPYLLDSLACQSYPRELYEVVVINDHSTDETRQVAAGYASNHQNIRVFDLHDLAKNSSPKKLAIAQGIIRSKGEIILTTDADCLVPQRWIEILVGHFGENTGAVMSWLQIKSRASLLNRIDAMDSFALVLIGAGAVGLGLPFVANAANFGYRKKVFEEVNGFQGIEQFVSGDDDLFLLKMRRKTNWQVAFANDPAACVWTRPASTWKHFFSQRIRWASKGTIYPLLLQTLEITIYGYYAVLVLMPLLALVKPSLLFFFITSFTVKVLLDGHLLRSGHKQLGRKWNYLDFLIGEGFNMAYILFVGIAGMFGKFQWKDRTYYRGKVMSRETEAEVEKSSM